MKIEDFKAMTPEERHEAFTAHRKAKNLPEPVFYDDGEEQEQKQP